jgi:hypothetical protein
MTTSPISRQLRRCLPLVSAAVIAVPLLGATAGPAEAATWVCANAYYHGQKVGSGCFRGNTARVCDTRRDGRTVYGTFAVRHVAVVTFRDRNGATAPCAYRTYSHPVVAASAFSRR